MCPERRELPRDSDASGRDLGEEEIALVSQAIRSGTLTSTKGHFVRDLEQRFAQCMGAEYGVACGSGTAAIHAAVSAIGLEPGDEVVTTSITDMGAITPILYEGGVPVFCDVDPATAVVTAETIAARIGPRTRAVIVTHLFGLPCDMAPILELARTHDLMVIEDCAQAPLGRDRGAVVGTLGHVGCFSFQQGKHMTTGEGGMVISGDAALAARLRKFVDKGWGYGEARPDHDFPALNGRMTELQGAVGLAQLEKLPSVVERRRESAAWMCSRLGGLAGIEVPVARADAEHVFWRFALSVNPARVDGGATRVAEALAAHGVASAPHYIQRPAYETAVFRAWRDHPVVAGPYLAAKRVPQPEAGSMPGTERALERLLVLPWNEHYDRADLAFLADAITRSASDPVSAQRAHG